MATVFLTPLSDSNPTLTSAIQSIKASTDKTKVEVSLVCDPDGDIDEFFTTTLYSFDGVVELSDVGSLIEQRFRELDVRTAPISCIIDGVDLNFIATYCEVEMPPEFDLEKSFYTSSAVQLVHRDSAVALAHFEHSHRNYKIRVVGHNPDGSIDSIERTFTRSQMSKFVSFSVDEILKWALNQTDEETGADIVSVAYFAIEYEQAQKVFYLVEDPFYLTFLYRNVFNAPEYLDVACTVKQTTKVTRELAVCSSKAIQYDRKASRTYEVTTGPLTVDEAHAVEQLIMSHEVLLVCAEDNYRILITDHTVEQDNDDESLTSIKFSFRFESERIRFTASDIESMAPARSKIFTQEFTAEFT